MNVSLLMFLLVLIVNRLIVLLTSNHFHDIDHNI